MSETPRSKATAFPGSLTLDTGVEKLVGAFDKL